MRISPSGIPKWRGACCWRIRGTEAFAFIAARIHTKLDDEFPEIIESLFSIIYPHYLRPMPSAAIAQMHLDPEQGKLMSGLRIAKGAMLHSAPVSGVPCKFRTCYDTVLWPLQVAGADWRTPDRVQPTVPGGNGAAVVRLELRCFEDVTFAKLGL